MLYNFSEDTLNYQVMQNDALVCDEKGENIRLPFSIWHDSSHRKKKIAFDNDSISK